MARSRKLRRYRGWIAIGIVAAVAASVWFITTRSTKAEETTTTYTTEAAENGALSVTVSGTGNLEIGSSREVWPATEGTVESLEVEQGDTVRKGQVLFTLDADDAEAATSKALASYRQAESGVAQADAQLTKAENSLDDLRDKADEPSSTVTSADIKAAKAEVASAKASLSSAKAQRSSAWTTYDDALDAEDDLEVTAPIAGVVWTLDIEEGDSVSTTGGGSASAATAASSGSTSGTGSGSSTAPLTIVPKKPLVATLAVNEVDIPSLKVGQRADIEFDALSDLAMTGKVTEIADEGTVDQGVVTFDVTVKLDVVNAKLKPGMTVTATIVTDVARNALLVPNAAVKTDDDDNPYVLVLADGQAAPQQVSVETGLASDTQTQILSGISAGDKVVTAESDGSEEEESESRGGPGGGMMMMGGGPGR